MGKNWIIVCIWGSISGLGRSPGEENGNPFQYFCLKNPHGQRSLVGYSPWDSKDMTERFSSVQSLSRVQLCNPVD